MKQETIFDISIKFSKTRYTFFCPFLPFPKVPMKNLLLSCVHDVPKSKAHVQRPLWQLFIRVSWFLDANYPGKRQTSTQCPLYQLFICISWFLDASYLGKIKTSTFYVNLYENVTSVGYLAQLLLFNPEKQKA